MGVACGVACGVPYGVGLCELYTDEEGFPPAPPAPPMS